MRKRSWIWAGFWTFCAILTRLQGAALIIPMLYLMWQDHPFLRKLAHWFGLGISTLGGLFYLFLRSRQVTDGTIPFVEAEWHARLVPPWETYWYAVQTLFSGRFTFIDALNWAVATLFMVLLIIGWRKIPLEYNLYSVCSLLIILIRIVETQPLIAMSRYSRAGLLSPCNGIGIAAVHTRTINHAAPSFRDRARKLGTFPASGRYRCARVRLDQGGGV
jgi:hypothetical protein